jgi:hypothetical protein
LNGPVPIMFVAQSEELSCAGAMMPNLPTPNMPLLKSAVGTLQTTFTVIGSTICTSDIVLKTMGSNGPTFGAPGTPRHESRLSFKASAFSGVPSWNLTPSRRRIVHSV